MYRIVVTTCLLLVLLLVTACASPSQTKVVLPARFDLPNLPPEIATRSTPNFHQRLCSDLQIQPMQPTPQPGATTPVSTLTLLCKDD